MLLEGLDVVVNMLDVLVVVAFVLDLMGLHF